MSPPGLFGLRIAPTIVITLDSKRRKVAQLPRRPCFRLVSVRPPILAKVPDCRSEAVATAGSMVLAPERKSGRQFTLAIFFVGPVFAMGCHDCPDYVGTARLSRNHRRRPVSWPRYCQRERSGAVMPRLHPRELRTGAHVEMTTTITRLYDDYAAAERSECAVNIAKPPELLRR